jgi:hypothetical protein
MSEAFVLEPGREQLAIRVVKIGNSQSPVLGDVTLRMKEAKSARPQWFLRSIVADGPGELCILE